MIKTMWKKITCGVIVLVTISIFIAHVIRRSIVYVLKPYTWVAP